MIDCDLNSVVIIEEAVRQFPDITALRSVKVILTDKLSVKIDGQFDHKTNIIKIPTRLCNSTEEYKDYVIAHELGHLITASIYGFIHNEQLADLYAARIYLKDKRQLLRIFEEQCSQGYINQCSTWKNWEYAIVH